MITYKLWSNVEHDTYNYLFCIIFTLPTILIDVLLSPFELLALGLYYLLELIADKVYINYEINRRLVKERLFRIKQKKY